MAVRTLPGLGLTGGYPDNSDGWGESMRDNLFRLSVLTQLSVLSRVTPPPTSGMTEGMIYIVPTGDLAVDKLKVYDDGAWALVDPEPGWVAYVEDEGLHYFWDETEWVRLVPEVEAAVTTLTISTKTANYSLVLADGGSYVRMNLATANTLTVPANASQAFPVGTVVQVRQAGAGQTTVVAAGGVTINTAETLKLRGQGSSAALIKVATDEWDLTGDLEAAP